MRKHPVFRTGSVRAVHAHNDVRHHLFIPAAGSVELTVGSNAPLAMTAGQQAQIIKKGTPHGFRNTGDTNVVIYEVFVREQTPASAALADAFRTVAAAGSGTSGRR